MDTLTVHEAPNFVTAPQCATLLHMSRWTIYHWISDGKLGVAQGLRRVGRRRLIDWNVLKAAIERSELG